MSYFMFLIMTIMLSCTQANAQSTSIDSPHAIENFKADNKDVSESNDEDEADDDAFGWLVVIDDEDEADADNDSEAHFKSDVYVFIPCSKKEYEESLAHSDETLEYADWVITPDKIESEAKDKSKDESEAKSKAKIEPKGSFFEKFKKWMKSIF